MSKLTAIPQNYKKNVQWIIGAYEDSGICFPDGFQKDAIQNSVGARKNHKWNNFKCEIYLVNNKIGSFLIIEDSGTLGLTGDNLSVSYINSMMENGEILSSDQRLARFSSMFNSGGNETGGGLYGAGKSVYSVASKKYIYYFDSLRNDGKYVANINKCGSVMEKALEADEAKKYIYKETGIKEKTTIGTRIIIVDPVDELVNSINDMSIVSYIQESWWKIISRLSDDSGIFVNNKKVGLPSFIEQYTKKYELSNQEYYSENYKIKHFGIYVYEDKNNDWNGISYYRKGMKIGEVDLKDVPEKIAGKFWGYIEVDEDWEEELADIEDKIHFGVSKGKKQKLAYQNLKRCCESKFNQCLLDWGYIKNKENYNSKLQERLNEIADNVQNLFDKLGIEELEKASKKSDINIRWQNVKYPEQNTQKVTTGDSISFTVRMVSTYNIDKKIEYSLFVKNLVSDEIISHISTEKLILKQNEVWTKDLSYVVSPQSATKNNENAICLTVKILGSSRVYNKQLVFYYDFEKNTNIKEVATLSINTITLPGEGRRVNYGDSITNISYNLENRRNNDLNYRINVSVHNSSDPSCPLIETICSFNGKLTPFESEIISIPDILISKEKYEKYLNKGILELRARLIANEDSGEFEKGDRITKCNYVIYLNMNDKNGRKDAFIVKSIDNKERHLRSWHGEEGNNKVIYINVGHIAYLKLEGYEEIQDDYLNELLLKEYLQLYLDGGRSDIFNRGNIVFSEAEPQEAVDLMFRKLEEVYYNSLK